jgi:peptidoglycan/xylan/chitin deacetylase (PgdA/CDA1 family)
MKALKEINRKLLSPLLMNLKGDRIIRSFASGSILNIMYHGVTKENSNYFSPRHISSGQFESQLKYYAREFDVISLSEAFKYLENNYKPKRKTLTISFDDGYRNNLRNVLPLLEKYNLKATFFVSGVCTEEMKIRALWTDIIGCLKYFHKDQIIDLGNKRFVNFTEAESKTSLGDFLSLCGVSDLDGYLNYLISKYNLEKRINSLPEDLWKILDQEELKELSASSIAEIGSHCHSHYKLAAIDISDARRELMLSKEAIQRVTGKEIRIVAFPYGSYNTLIKDEAEKLGYDHQIAVDYLFREDAGDPRILNRHGIPSTTTYEANILLLNNAFRSKGYN